MDEILLYLYAKYHPLAVISYGSFNDGSKTDNSDYDALLIVEDGTADHDMDFVYGVQLDVFVYPKEYIEALTDYNNVIQVWDGKVLRDTDNIATNLVKNVNLYIHSQPFMTEIEKEKLKIWCYKMIERTQRDDLEGSFRWHWLLVDSLEIYSNVRNYRFYGPKKAIHRMKAQDWEGYQLYNAALQSLSGLRPWIDYVFKPMEE